MSIQTGPSNRDPRSPETSGPITALGPLSPCSDGVRLLHGTHRSTALSSVDRTHAGHAVAELDLRCHQAKRKPAILPRAVRRYLLNPVREWIARVGSGGWP